MRLTFALLMKTNEAYQDLLNSEEWRNKRTEIIARDKVCKNCGTNQRLQVHHRQYHWDTESDDFVAPWQYAEHLLVTLCESCHKAGHEHYGKVPVMQLNRQQHQKHMRQHTANRIFLNNDKIRR